MRNPRGIGNFVSRVRIVVLLALIASLVAAPGKATAPRGGSFELPDFMRRTLPVDAVVARTTRTATGASHTDPQKLRRPADYIASAFTGRDSFRDPHNFMRVARTYLEAIWKTHLPTLRDRVRAEAAAQASTSTDPIAVDRYGFPAGDITGDGLEDVGSLEAHYNYLTFDLISVTMDGVRGTDGNHLWSAELPMDVYDGFIIPAGDLTGDGAADFLLVELFIDSVDDTGGCAIVACALDDVLDWRWVLEVVAGSDGTRAWSKTFPGHLDDTFLAAGALVAGASFEQVTATNLFVAPYPSVDHNADGGDDLVVNAFDLSGKVVYADAPAAYTFQPDITVATHASVLSGATAGTLFTRDASFTNGGADLEPVGGGSPNLLWQALLRPGHSTTCVLETCVDGAKARLNLELLNGSGFGSLWTSQIGDDTLVGAAVWPALGDLTGDGAPDFFFEQLTNEAGDRRWRTGVVGASSGALLWTSDPLDWVQIIGPIGGAPGNDLLAVTYEWSQAYDVTGVSLVRIDGGTGTTLATTHHSVPAVQDGYVDVYVTLSGDTNGDQVQDVAFYTHSSDFFSSLATTTTLIESGRDGSTIYSLESQHDEFASPMGDADGDGNADLLSIRFTAATDGSNLDLKSLLMPDATTAWSKTEWIPDSGYVSIVPSPDQSGLGGADLIVTRALYLPSGGEQSRIEGVEGRNGVSQWGYGDGLTPPPPPSAAGIQGTVTDTSAAPVDDICVTAFDEQNNIAGVDLTTPAGSYAIFNIPDGVYKVQFRDCFNDVYAEQWYNGKPDAASADAITVAGAMVNGIDAVLSVQPPPPVLRTETKPYVALVGDEFVTGPLPGGLVNDCNGDGQSLGGTCFQLNGTEAWASFVITDANATAAIAAEWAFTDDTLPLPYTFTRGTFCGTSPRVHIPSGAVEVYIFTYAARTAEECTTEPGTPTTGTITATFY